MKYGQPGIFRWDGLDDQQNLLPMGHYMIYTELFLLDGSVKKNLSVCVLARKRKEYGSMGVWEYEK